MPRSGRLRPRQGMTVTGYAESRGVRWNTIRHAIRTGLIIPYPDGGIDPAQADASWGERHMSGLRRVRMPRNRPVEPPWDEALREVGDEIVRELS